MVSITALGWKNQVSKMLNVVEMSKNNVENGNRLINNQTLHFSTFVFPYLQFNMLKVLLSTRQALKSKEAVGKDMIRLQHVTQLFLNSHWQYFHKKLKQEMR